jgi:hypothetical protein
MVPAAGIARYRPRQLAVPQPGQPPRVVGPGTFLKGSSVADFVELEARIAALEMVLTTHMLQSGIGTLGFDPTAFATGRRDAWSAIGNAMCEACTSQEEERRFTQAYAAALERLGNLLVTLAEPVQEAIDEVQQMGGGMAGRQA